MNVQILKCQECEKAVSTIFCQDCEQYLCSSCSEILHKGGTRKLHELIPLMSDTQETAKKIEKILENQESYKEADLLETTADTRISNQNSIGVYWDMYRASSDLREIKETVLYLNSRYGKHAEIKLYGKETRQIQVVDMKNQGIIMKSQRDVSEIGNILTDMSQETRRFNKQVLITSRAYAFRSQLVQLISALGSCHVFLLNSPTDTYEIPADQIPDSPNSKKWPKSIRDITDSDREVYKFNRRKAAASESSLETSMIVYLKSQAYQGIIMHESKELSEKMGKRLGISKAYACDLINTGCKFGKLLQQVKRIGSLDFSIISLKVEKLSSKVLLWVLRSLKNDEMISTEKAIQSRLKEAFDIKIPPHVWTNFLEYNIKSSRIRHKKSLSDSQGFSFFSQSEERAVMNFSFCMKNIKDLGSGAENLVIYPINEEWVSYDQYIKSGDVFKIKQTYEWDSFVKFFEQLFNIESPEERAISGGRYGCAQYLKHYSPFLKNSSLGKLSYMIQLAIDDELLRYHKTLLVWVPIFDKKCKEDKLLLYHSKKAIVEALNQYGDGISLAQLPTLLKEKMPFELDLAKIGFAKLKDLIISIPDLELISKGKNHPFVKIRKIPGPSAEGLASFLCKVFESAEERLKVQQIEIEVCENFGYNWKTAGKIRSLEEFLKTSSEFLVTEKGLLEKKHKSDIYHSYSSSTTSDAYSYGPMLDNQSGDSELWGKNKEFPDNKFQYIVEMLDEDEGGAVDNVLN